jgi:hypothetical protein
MHSLLSRSNAVATILKLSDSASNLTNYSIRFIRRQKTYTWLISHQPVVLFSQIKLATSNQPAVLFSQHRSAPAISTDEDEIKQQRYHNIPQPTNQSFST